tara:strand:- start:68 stop:280 length:213 start_codon:yes stop_codon:yes gene_type:complete
MVKKRGNPNFNKARKMRKHLGKSDRGTRIDNSYTNCDMCGLKKSNRGITLTETQLSLCDKCMKFRREMKK